MQACLGLECPNDMVLPCLAHHHGGGTYERLGYMLPVTRTHVRPGSGVRSLVQTALGPKQSVPGTRKRLVHFEEVVPLACV